MGGGGLPAPRRRGDDPAATNRAERATIDSQVVRMDLPSPSLAGGRQHQRLALSRAPRTTKCAACAAAALATLAAACGDGGAVGPPAWPQWGQSAQHTGSLAVTGQALRTIDIDYVYDPLVATEIADDSGALN